MTKYRAKPITIDGMRFASQKEGRRYEQLKLLVRAGQIARLELQPRFKLVVNGNLVGTYRPDFQYIEKSQQVVEEIKGYVVRDYPLRRNLFRALFPHIEHREI